MDDRAPRSAPPAAPRERRGRPPGRGFVWQTGFYNWNDGRWEWTAGHWERERRGKRWRAHNWELRNGVYVRIDGDWIDDGPDQAPPPPRAERFANRRGFTWVPGQWDWQNGQYIWVAGHYERERRGKRWRQAKWEQRNGAWIRVDGDWDDDVAVDVGYPTVAPPPLRDERPGARRGFTWVRGTYEWRDGQYQWVNGHWERERASQRWVDGRWEHRNGRWEWIAGQWDRAVTCGAEPSLDRPPPGALKPETIVEQPGRFEVKGHWTWDRTGCDYVWSPGYLESARAGYRYVPGNWNQGNGRWYWVEPRWEQHSAPPPPPSYPSGPTSPPPAPPTENPEARRGFVWIRGHHEWRTNKYEWIAGHWERARARQNWVDGRWERQGRVYVWIPGTWQ